MASSKLKFVFKTTSSLQKNIELTTLYSNSFQKSHHIVRDDQEPGQ
jgi:hypothetical protein